mgnify:CR=1 FL=1
MAGHSERLVFPRYLWRGFRRLWNRTEYHQRGQSKATSGHPPFPLPCNVAIPHLPQYLYNHAATGQHEDKRKAHNVADEKILDHSNLLFTMGREAVS